MMKPGELLDALCQSRGVGDAYRRYTDSVWCPVSFIATERGTLARSSFRTAVRRRSFRARGTVDAQHFARLVHLPTGISADGQGIDSRDAYHRALEELLVKARRRKVRNAKESLKEYCGGIVVESADGSISRSTRRSSTRSILLDSHWTPLHCFGPSSFSILSHFGGLMSEETNKELVRRAYAMMADGAGRGNLDGMDDFIDPNAKDHNPDPGQGPGRQGIIDSFLQLGRSIPDLRVDVQDLVAEGDRVAARVRFEGTHQGELNGIPSTGRRVSIEVIDFLRIQDGKLVERWGIVDQMGMMQQLGVMPADDQTIDPVSPSTR